MTFTIRQDLLLVEERKMTKEEMGILVLKVIIASFSTVGLMEYLKNFIKTKKTWLYSLLMPIFAIGCYLACEYLPVGVIGGLLTVGCVQLDYQVIVQGFKKAINKTINKIDKEE